MAFGAVLGTLGINALSITNPFTATGSVVVAVGDLVVAVLAQQTDLTVTGVTDNLGNTYTAQNAGTDAGSVAGRAFYSRVTVAGTLTGVSAACTASTDNAAFAVAVFAGPVTAPPIDANPANISNDITTPFTCPATGVLAQAAELVVGWVAGGGSSTAYTATAPNVLVANQQISSTVATAAIGSQVVAATTTVAPAFATSVPSTDVLGTMSFKQDTSIVPQPNGWFGQINTKAAIAALAVATQATTFAVPAPPSNSVSQFGWHQPLSSAAPVAKAQAGFASVPFNTPQVAPSSPSGWQTIQSAAPPKAVVNASALTFVVPPFAVPSGWQSQLSTAPPVPQAKLGASFVPLDTPQVSATPNPSGWRSQSPSAVRVAQAQPTQATAFAVPPQASNSVSQFGWYAPLSTPAPVAKTKAGSSFVPFDTAQIASARPQGWYQPLSIAAPVAQAKQGNAFVPLNIAQAAATPPPNGWFGPIQTAAKVAKATPTQATTFGVPPQVATTPTPDQFGWYAPLSKAVPVAQAKPGSSFVPFDTVQAPTPSTAIGVPLVQDAGYPSVVNVYYQAMVKPLAPMAPVQNTVAQLAWQQPLSVAPKLAQAAPQGSSFVPLNTAQVPPLRTLAWVQPLSKPVPVAQALQGSFFVPLNTVQLSNRVTGFGWYAPLSKPAPVAQAKVGSTFVPLDTVQVAPPPPPVVLAVPGGSSRRLDGRPWGASYRTKEPKKVVAKVEAPIALPPTAKVAPVPVPQVVIAPVVPIEVRYEPPTEDDEAALMAVIDQHLQDEAKAREMIAAMLNEIIADLENDEDI